MLTISTAKLSLLYHSTYAHFLSDLGFNMSKIKRKTWFRLTANIDAEISAKGFFIIIVFMFLSLSVIRGYCAGA